MTVKVASDWLNSCSGCEISIVDMGERLLDVLKVAQFVHLPALMDHKYFGQMGDGKHISIPEADVGILSGGLRNQEHVEVAEAFRKSCKIIIALGTCATHGGIPSLANSFTNQEIFERYYSTETTAPVAESFPERDCRRCWILHGPGRKIAVDIYMPGCPPHPDHIFSALVALVEGRRCCRKKASATPARPAEKARVGRQNHAPLSAGPEYGAAGEPLDQMRCLLEQGFMCMGPVTRAGCGGDAILPRCVSARVPCRGCYGPVQHNGNQRLDMLNALASNGIDIGCRCPRAFRCCASPVPTARRLPSTDP
jgi:F420-non-reducing hydrogenase small subunit